MDLLTAKQASEKWGISTRRVTRLCEEGSMDTTGKKENMILNLVRNSGFQK